MERKCNVVTLFKGNIIIPDKDNKNELIWLEDKPIEEIFTYGVAQHLIHIQLENQKVKANTGQALV